MKTTAAKCSKSIKSMLKLKYPNLKIYATSRIFSGGDAVQVRIVGEVSIEQKCEINTIIDQYQEGNFDGMQDLYKYDNVRSDIPQVKYVVVNFE